MGFSIRTTSSSGSAASTSPGEGLQGLREGRLVGRAGAAGARRSWRRPEVRPLAPGLSRSGAACGSEAAPPPARAAPSRRRAPPCGNPEASSAREAGQAALHVGCAGEVLPAGRIGLRRRRHRLTLGAVHRIPGGTPWIGKASIMSSRRPGPCGGGWTLGRPVDPRLVEECLEIAVQAPTGGNLARYHFVVGDGPRQEGGGRRVLPRVFFEEYLPRRARRHARLPRARAAALPTRRPTSPSTSTRCRCW